MCRIHETINEQSSKLKANGSFLCLNWTLLILAASVQATLMIFYSLGLMYQDN